MGAKTSANTFAPRLVATIVAASFLGAPAITLGAETTPSPQSAPRGEFLVGLGVSGGTSNWSGDPAGYGSVIIGFRLFGIITPFAEARVGAGVVDQRLLTLVSIGVAGTFHATKTIAPRAFVGAVHQHEESMAAVAEEPFGALLGIGGGIRHRAGIQVGIACDFTVYDTPKFVVTLGPELRGTSLTYSSGPSLYGQIGAAAHGHFRLF